MTQPAHDAIRELVRTNPGQGTVEEYALLHDHLRGRAPCRLLVFGVGRDSQLWIDANAGGRTVFLEDNSAWIASVREHVPGIDVHTVAYGTRRFLWRLLRLRPQRLLIAPLPEAVRDTVWDCIFVDGPAGFRPWDPGRMKSIYTAAQLASGGDPVDVFVHDCDRAVERAYADTYLGAQQLVGEAGRMRHYRLGGPR